MKKWKHMTIENRKTICSCISHKYKVKDIAKLISFDPTSISKEVKRNRIKYQEGYKKEMCPKLNRWPYVCTNCYNKYKSCHFDKYKYDFKIAQRISNANLINSRKGLDIEKESFNEIDKLIKLGTDQNKSLYQIKMENKEVIDKSLTTLYRYINKGYLTTKRIDLPYAVKYKKKKV